MELGKPSFVIVVAIIQLITFLIKFKEFLLNLSILSTRNINFILFLIKMLEISSKVHDIIKKYLKKEWNYFSDKREWDNNFAENLLLNILQQ